VRRAAVFAALAAAGLVLAVWPALRAPAVLWSDSELDLRWARTSPLRPSAAGEEHTPKPGYVLYLAAASRAFPALGPGRSAVVVQSLLLWLSIVGTSWHLFRRRGAAGLLLLVLLLSFLRLRDASSSVLSDAPAAALFLAVAGFCLEPPRSRAALALLGVGLTLLFWVRPNVGAVAVPIAAILLSRPGSRRALGIVALTCVASMAPVWLLTRPVPGDDALRGIGAPVLMGSARYYWTPSLGDWRPADSRARFATAERNWRAFLSGPRPDVQRELAWRAFHGLFGAEFYDARWSRSYARFDEIARRASPFLLLAALFLFATTPWRGIAGASGEKSAGVLLLALLVGHDLLFGSHPRYILPFLPALFLLCVAGAGERRSGLAARSAATSVALVAVAILLERNRGILDWEWGVVESAGVALVQTIPRGALPERGPATLHVRIAPVLPSNVAVDVYAPNRRLLLASSLPWPREPFLTVPLPPWLLEQNRKGAVQIELISRGSLDPGHYLLFPVVPPPWGTPARREGAKELSPTSGVSDGSLDWWAHAGAP
jgi:hypothetical protein